MTPYGLDGEVLAAVPEDDIALARADATLEVKRLISYAIGCMMGRYSVAEPGLICASRDNTGLDAPRYGAFAPDEDGIIPVTDTDWFPNDAANRFAEFLEAAWRPEAKVENLHFVADSIGIKSGEIPIDTVRRYFSRDYYKDHLKIYKKRPIYWLFSSGKEKAFEALVYLHRYNEGTLSRMRMEYVTPLQGRIAARIEQLDRDIKAASSTAAQTKLRKELEVLKRKQAELVKFDEELRHYADMRISLDLDDGVKVNYGRFGNLLAEVKAVTGGSDE
jgi:type II restriction/modification system DNA methylase subunit YeeA